jgi:hypothetical protein
MLIGGGELVAAVQRVLAGEVDAEGGRLQHADGELGGQLDQDRHRVRVPAEVGRDDERVSRGKASSRPSAVAWAYASIRPAWSLPRLAKA